jgi:hypothetical protein
VSEPFCDRFLIPAEGAAGDFRPLCGEPLGRVIGDASKRDVLPVVLAVEFTEDLPDSLRAALALGDALCDGESSFLFSLPR